MSKTIHVSKESVERFKHDKDVVGATNRVPCPINNGADLNSDAMLDALFDDGQYVESEPQTNHFEVVGFIDGAAIIADYWLRSNTLSLKTIHPVTDGLRKSYETLLQTRLSDEQVEPVILAFDNGEYEVYFYYRPEYAEQFNS